MSTTSSSRANNLVLLGVVACFVLSGFAALLYQTAWMRQFSLVFGTSELAIAAVLSAYMGGLSLGALLAGRYVYRISRPVLFYGLLEAGIAVSALTVPFFLRLARILYVGLFGGQPNPVDASGLGQPFFYLAIAFVVLAIPTMLMGATLPLLTKYVVQSKEQIGSRVGLLYATNTLGAIGGTVVAGFVLLPLLGLNGTVWAGVVINCLVFVLAAALARHIGARAQLAAVEPEFVESDTDGKEDAPTSRYWILPIMLFSGANSFVYEVLWTRLLGHVLGGSVTAFATMLAGFLGGIAIGSAVASRFSKTRVQATHWFIAVQCGIALTSMLIYQLLPLAIPATVGPGSNVPVAIMVLLPATIFIGATFPLAVRILAKGRTDAAPASAHVYSWNTVGAILGATAAAFFLIPILKYEGAIHFAVALNAALALAAASVLGKLNKAVVASVLVFMVGIIGLYQPKMPEDILRGSPVFVQPSGEIIFYEVGRSATVLVIEEHGYLNLRTNGLPEASTSLKGAPPYIHNQRMLSTMPVLARPDTETMLVVGLGAGVALERVPASVSKIDVIELETEVVRANQFYGDVRAINPLDDPRVIITINDARSALSLTDKTYDAIVSQPSHPWTAGASHLYTREFMALAKDHLTEDGVYLQWMSSQFVDEFLLKSLCATMLGVFSYVRVYQWNSEELFFIGSERPLDVESQIAVTGRPLVDDPLGYLEKGIGSVEDVVAALAMDQDSVEAFAAGGRVITDNYNYMATRSARVMTTEESLAGSRVYEVLSHYDPLLDAFSSLRQGFPVRLNYPYIARRLDRLMMKQRAVDLADSLLDRGDEQALIMIALGLQEQGDQQEAQRNLLLALQADPGNQQARYALLAPWFNAFRSGEHVPSFIAEQFRLLGGTARDTFNAWLAASDGAMREVAELDAQLASVDPSDLWYETSVKLRADWRIKVTTPEYQPRLANEATALIDSAIVFSQDSQFFSMRMQSTLLANDPVSSVETAQRLAYRLDQDLEIVESQGTDIAVGAAESRSRQVSQIRDLINAVQGDSRVSADKLKALEAYVQGIAERIERP